MGLPLLDDYDAILSVVDHSLTKGVILIPCNKTFSALDTAQALLDHVYKWFGLPDKMISDHRPQFTAESIRELLRLLRIQLSHPQLITLKTIELQKGTTKRLKHTW